MGLNSAMFVVDTTSLTNVDTLESMFEGAAAFNQDIDTTTLGWKLDDVTTFTNMFKGATTFNQDISDWTVTSGSKFISMFEGAIDFNKNLNAWAPSGVNTNGEMATMFNGATKFQQNLCGWAANINGAFTMTNMFASTACPTDNADGTFANNNNADEGAVCCDCTANADTPTATYPECLVDAS